jgi:hypothetical protein
MAPVGAGHLSFRRVARLPVTALAAVLGCAATTTIALSDRATGDYVTHGRAIADNAGPALVALAHGNLAGFVANQPAMGLTSLILRAPIVWAVRLLGGGDQLAYRLGAAACLLPLGLLAAWLIVQPATRTRGRQAGAIAAGLLLLSPPVRTAVAAGHPEDVLAAVLDTVAALAAMRGRTGWAAALLALAIGSKPWAAIGAAPVLLAAPRGQRVSTLARAAALSALVTFPLALANPGAFAHAFGSMGQTHLVNAFSFLWPLSHPVQLPNGQLAASRWLPLGLSRSTASSATLAIALLALALAWRGQRREARAVDALALLALLGLLRCLCDTTQLEYYRVAVLVPLVVWEAVGLGRLPVIGALATGAVALMPSATAHLTPTATNAVSATLSLLLLTYLAGHAIGAWSRPSIKAPRVLVDT